MLTSNFPPAISCQDTAGEKTNCHYFCYYRFCGQQVPSGSTVSHSGLLIHMKPRFSMKSFFLMTTEQHKTVPMSRNSEKTLLLSENTEQRHRVISINTPLKVLDRLALHQAQVAISIAQINETQRRQEESIAAANRSLQLVSGALQMQFDDQKVA